MKELELVVHEKAPGQYRREATYNSPDGSWAYPSTRDSGYAQDKRLTDPELAAIYWGFVQTDMLRPDAQADSDETDPDYWDAACKRWKEAEEIVLRFAALPHYDEQEAS